MTAGRAILASLVVLAYLATVLGFLVWSVRQHRRERAWDAWLARLHRDEARRLDTPPSEGTTR